MGIKITYDKFMHALLCFIIALMAGFILLGCGCPLVGCLVGAAIPALTAGLVKEWTDQEYGSSFDFKDLLADLAGTALAVIALFFIIFFRRIAQTCSESLYSDFFNKKALCTALNAKGLSCS